MKDAGRHLRKANVLSSSASYGYAGEDRIRLWYRGFGRTEEQLGLGELEAGE
jgi:hypothetical protein